MTNSNKFPFIDFGKYLGKLFDSWDACKSHRWAKNGRYRTCLNCGKQDFDD